MASPGRDVKLSEDRVKGYRNFLNKLWNANNFLLQNKCEFKNRNKHPKIKININKWIYAGLLETKQIVEKNIKEYRFDEAARNVYQFVWHSFCDWYLELSKTILFSKNKKNISEIREVASFIFKEILVLLHPFIPFVTEEIWLKNKLDNSGKSYLMFSNWISGKIKKDKDFKEVEKAINIISQIRSFKNELNVTPGSFIDVSLGKITKKNQIFFKDNEIILKKLGRINNFFKQDQKKPAATLVIERDLFRLYFEENIDLNLIKVNLINKQQKYINEIDKISSRLNNKNFVDRAPKNIVDQEKTHYNNLKNDIKKISLTIESL
jgi:valyl-tRNA synthetase